MTNATRSSMSVMPLARRETRALSIFMVEGLGRTVVVDRDVPDLRIPLPRLRAARIRGVERTLPVLDVEADVELPGVVLVAGALHLDVGAGRGGVDDQDVVVHPGRVPELALPVH